MTLILTVTTENVVWMGADRKLARPGDPNFATQGTKICRMDLSNGKGALGYSGLGAKVSGDSIFEVSEWAKRALVGTKLDVKTAFLRIVHEANRKIVGHSTHTQEFLWAGFEDTKPAVYYARIQPDEQGGIELGRVAVAEYGAIVSAMGSGKTYINKSEADRLCALAKRIGDKRGSADELESEIAKLLKVASEREAQSQDPKERLLSPESIVATTMSDGTGWTHQYDKTAKKIGTANIPVVAGGFDVNAILNVLLKHSLPELHRGLANIEDGKAADMHINTEKINAEFKSLPLVPDIRFWDSDS